MKASDIVEDALQLRGVLQKELAERVGQDHKYLSKKLRTNNIKSEEFIYLLYELGYEIILLDRVRLDEEQELIADNEKAQGLIDSIHNLGYEIKLMDRQKNGQTVSIRHRGTGPRVKHMVGGITFDTAKADALCHTDVEDGRYMELYRDQEGRFFIVHYSFWQKEDSMITACQEDEARHLFEKYADGTVEFSAGDTPMA